MNEKYETNDQFTTRVATQTEVAIPMNDLILKKSKLSAQTLDCYEILIESQKQFPNTFCVEFGVLQQMIRDL